MVVVSALVVLVPAELVVEVVLCAPFGMLESVGPSNTNPSTADTCALLRSYKILQIRCSRNE